MEIGELVKWGLPAIYIELLRNRGITELNPVQEEAIRKGVFNGENIVISTPTASGKTLVAEMLLVKRALNGHIGVYLTPLKALASEKYEEFKQLERLGLSVGITTGDYDQPAEYLGKHDLIIATYERFDSLLRLKPSWIDRVKVIVVDEIHNINDPDRGPIIEMIIARALRNNMQILGLSATIGNPEVLANWVKGKLVNLDWRPVKLVEGVYDRRDNTVVFNDGRREEISDETGDRIMDVVLHNIMEKDHQTLVFIHNRKRVEEYAEHTSERLPSISSKDLDKLIRELEEAPTSIERDLLTSLMRKGVAFHHAGLSHMSRKVVENAFKMRLLKVVYATPTLAAGVNMPARRVVVSIKRYDPVEGKRVNIPVMEYKQMAGRAGRPRYDDIGEAIIIDAKNLEEGMKYINSKPEPIRGKLFNERSLRIHALSLIASQEADKLSEIIEVLNHTFSAFYASNILFTTIKIQEAIKLLEELDMINKHGEYIHATRLGKITSYTYLDPLSVHIYLSLKPRSYSDLYLLHLVCITPDFKKSSPYIPDKLVHGFEELAESYANMNMIPPYKSDLIDYDDWLTGFIHAMILNDWINERTEDEIVDRYGIGPGDLYSMRDTASWITSSLSKIEGVLGDVNMRRKLETLTQRIEKGVREDAVELASLRYIGRVRARILIQHGIRTLRDLANTPRHKIESLPKLGPRVVDEIYKQLKEMGYLN
ncbi:MAG: DEAD/DEAH box helicase [Desulfurococcaceae archaeon]